MSAPFRTVKFVDAPTATANVRYDVVTEPTRFIEFGSWSDESPELLGDPEGSGQEYGRRVVSFTQVVQGTYTEAAAARSALAREILRDGNWLMVKRTTASPTVFYRTFPSSPGQSVVLQDDGSDETDVWTLSVTVECEPHIYGESEAFTLSINNNPAAPGIAATMPTIKGDAPAPLSVSFTASAAVTPTLVSSALSSWPGVAHWQAESGTLGTDATVTADATGSGGSVVVVNPAATTDAKRLTLAPVLAQAGTYRLYARVKASVSTTSYSVRGAGTSVTSPTTSTVLGTSWTWIDLGKYRFPTRNMPTSSGYTLGAGNVEVWAARATTGTLSLDSVVAVPIDLFEGSSRVQHLPAIASGSLVSANAELDALTLTSGGALVAGVVSPEGLFLRATPGATNVVHYFARPSASLGSTQTLNFSYYPRYLWVP